MQNEEFNLNELLKINPVAARQYLNQAPGWSTKFRILPKTQELVAVNCNGDTIACWNDGWEFMDLGLCPTW